MIDDLHLRNYSDRTIKAYLRCVSNFARHFGKSPDELGPAQIREYQLYLVKQKQCSWAVFNQTVCALRFLYNTTLGCKEMIEEIPYPRFEKRLPVVLSQTEVAALLHATRNLKHQALLTTIYATGLRVSEVTNLVVGDVDSSRMIEVCGYELNFGIEAGAESIQLSKTARANDELLSQPHCLFVYSVLPDTPAPKGPFECP